MNTTTKRICAKSRTEFVVALRDSHGLARHCLVLKLPEGMRRTKGLRRKLLTKVKSNRPWAVNINSDTLSSQSTGSPVRIDWADVA